MSSFEKVNILTFILYLESFFIEMHIDSYYNIHLKLYQSQGAFFFFARVAFLKSWVPSIGLQTHTHTNTHGHHIHTCMQECLQPYTHIYAYIHMNSFTCTRYTTDTHTCTSMSTYLYINRHQKHHTHMHTCTHAHTETYSWHFSVELDYFVLYMYWVNLTSKSVLRN